MRRAQRAVGEGVAVGGGGGVGPYALLKRSPARDERQVKSGRSRAKKAVTAARPRKGARRGCFESSQSCYPRAALGCRHIKACQGRAVGGQQDRFQGAVEEGEIGGHGEKYSENEEGRRTSGWKPLAGRGVLRMKEQPEQEAVAWFLSFTVSPPPGGCGGLPAQWFPIARFRPRLRLPLSFAAGSRPGFGYNKGKLHP